jgi:hypothetical protein
MKKQHILKEIKRTAEANGGVPLGVARFYRETGIKESDWHGKYWARWGDALSEAGFAPNVLKGPIGEDELIEKYIELIRELGRLPVRGEIKLKRRRDPDFPSHNVFARFGTKSQLSARILDYCQNHKGFDDVVPLCDFKTTQNETDTEEDEKYIEKIGFVYLLKFGRHYKIGRTNAFGRRERELAIQLPEKARTVHVIRTDDPEGIEAYWHKRFAAKRKEGEWFELDSSDIKAFKRRKFM